MSKWIDYNAIDYRNDKLHDKSSDFLDGVIYMAQCIEDAPSIDIVRCKECKHYAEHNELYINAPTNCVKHSTINHYVVVNADDFCSYGERRES